MFAEAVDPLQSICCAAAAAVGLQLRSGDEDLVPRRPLQERRAVFDAVAARRLADGGSDGELADEDFDGASGRHSQPRSGKRRQQERFGEEDEFYTSSKAARSAVKAAKKAKHEAPQLAPPLPDQEAVGQRKISYEIEKNRGLTPHRLVAVIEMQVAVTC
jgi:U3 small nucleolar RNA-associated protein 3